MRRGLPMVPALLILLVITACSGSIKWEDSIEEALALSERDGKPVMLYFTFHG
jgi:hypothetical protein